MSIAPSSHRVPWLVVTCAAGLMLIGLSGIRRGDELTGVGDLADRQTIWILMGVPAMFATTLIPYRRYRNWSHLLFAFSILLLVIVYLMPSRNGAHRWIPFGVMDFQPSELAKIAFIMALAHYLMYRKNYRTLSGLIVPFLITLVPVALILREPDLGTSLLFLPVLFSMLFAAGARPRHLVVISLMGITMLPGLWLGMSAEQRSRVVTLMVQEDTGPAPRGDGYHLHQSKQMLTLGKTWGSEVEGMTLSDPAAYHLPAGRTDFVFCLVGERWGSAGCVATLLLYLILFARGLLIAAHTREPYGRLLAVGIVVLLGSQMLINTGMTVGLMPITGMTLPLMSYGGSSLLATCVALGLLINISMRPGYEVAHDPFVYSDVEA
ncbi:MAG: FtsW/RodA/SpoVE family cell cycle protein [Planctomycetaceae bacterium]